MFKWKTLAGLALAASVLVAPATADALTLSQRVAKVEAKLACLQYAGLSEWNGYAAYVGGDGLYTYDAGIDITGASFDVANGYPHSAGDFRVVVVKPTSTCRPSSPRRPTRTPRSLQHGQQSSSRRSKRSGSRASSRAAATLLEARPPAPPKGSGEAAPGLGERRAPRPEGPCL